VAIFEVAFDGTLRYANRRFVALLGYGLDELPTLERFWQLAFPEQAYRQWAQANWEFALARARKFAASELGPIEYHVIRKDGGRRLVELSATILADGLLISCGDVTEQVASREDLILKLHQLEQLNQSVPVGLFLVDRQSRFLYVNRRLADINGRSPEEHQGRSIFDVIPNLAESAQELHRQVFERGEPVLNVEMRGTASEEQGERDWLVSLTPFRAATGEIAGLIGAVIDITKRKQAERSLAESQIQLRGIVDSTADLIWAVDPHSFGLSYFNDSLKEHFALAGIPVTLGMRPEDLYDDRVFIDTWHSFYRRTLEVGSLNTAYWSHAAPKILMLSFHLLVHDGTVFGISVFAKDVTEQHSANVKLQELNSKLHALTEHLQTVQEQERLTIARDIHDDIGQDATALKLDLAWLERRLPGESTKLHERAAAMQQIVDRLTATVQRVTSRLRPTLLADMTLTAAIESHVADFRLRTGLQCYTMLNEDTGPLPEAVATELMRIVQEALTNIVRHARGATEVGVSLCKRDGTLLLEITDNGRGIEPEQLAAPTSFGLMGMQERARMCQGELTIDSKPGEGTTLRLSVPITTGEDT
jgi:PAS domain S-box-containing protein